MPEFPDDLATNTARCSDGGAVGDNGYGFYFYSFNFSRALPADFALCHGGEYGGAFGAIGRAKAGVFNIASSGQRAVGQQNRRTNVEFGIRGVGV